MNNKPSWALATPVLLAAHIAFAQTPPPSVGIEGETAATQAGKTTILLGGLVGFGPQYEGSNDYEPAYGPIASVRWADGYAVSLGPSTMRTYQLRADVVPSRNWQFGPLLQRRQGRKGVDDNRVDNLENIDAAWEAGVHFGYRLGIDPRNGTCQSL